MAEHQECWEDGYKFDKTVNVSLDEKTREQNGHDNRFHRYKAVE